jgi:hypothetical protein
MPVHAIFASSRYLAPKVRAFVDLAGEHIGPIGRKKKLVASTASIRASPAVNLFCDQHDAAVRVV